MALETHFINQCLSLSVYPGQINFSNHFLRVNLGELHAHGFETFVQNLRNAIWFIAQYEKFSFRICCDQELWMEGVERNNLYQIQFRFECKTIRPTETSQDYIYHASVTISEDLISFFLTQLVHCIPETVFSIDETSAGDIRFFAYWLSRQATKEEGDKYLLSLEEEDNCSLIRKAFTGRTDKEFRNYSYKQTAKAIKAHLIYVKSTYALLRILNGKFRLL